MRHRSGASTGLGAEVRGGQAAVKNLMFAGRSRLGRKRGSAFSRWGWRGKPNGLEPVLSA